MNNSYRLGVDVGGTFTDLVLVDDAGKLTEAKTPSTPSEPGLAMREGLSSLAASVGISREDLLRNCCLIIHGTTIAVNTLIEHTGARTGLVCTDGFRDSLEIRLGYRSPELRYDFGHPPPPVMVPRRLRIPVRERIDKNGMVRVPLVEQDVYRCIERFREEEVEAVAVSLLWSFRNKAHEQRVGEIIREELPGVYLSLSHEVSPQLGEYARVSTTVMNSYVGPRVVDYVETTEAILRSMGFQGVVHYLQSNGGISTAFSFKQRPVLGLNSGPAAGPAAGLLYGDLIEEKNLITTDMGGTSFDACLIDNGHPSMVTDVDVHGYRCLVPMVDLKTVGAGGGSIAWLDAGILRVGPGSAGAVPGPACYLRGGVDPTVTDADMVLGYLHPEALLGGRFPVDRGAAREAVRRRIGEPLGLTPEEASQGIFEVVNKNMANALGEISLERGYDPRDFVVVAAGGQGPLHAGAILEALGARSILIPKNASTFCAFGAVVSDLRYDYKVSHPVQISEADTAELERIFLDLEQKGRAALANASVPVDSVEVVRKLDARYLDQMFEVSLDISDLSPDEASPRELRRRLDEQHEREYTYYHEGIGGEIIHVGVTVVGRLLGTEVPILEEVGPDPSQALTGERLAHFKGLGEFVLTPVYDGCRLKVGNVISGPAIVEEPNTTIVVFPAWELRLMPYNCYTMRYLDARA